MYIYFIYLLAFIRSAAHFHRRFSHCSSGVCASYGCAPDGPHDVLSNPGRACNEAARGPMHVVRQRCGSTLLGRDHVRSAQSENRF